MSVLEIARLNVRPESDQKFPGVFKEARKCLDQAQGCLAVDLTRSVLEERKYILRVTWAKLADHVETFVSSGDFTAFRDLIWPYLASDPDLKHFQELADLTTPERNQQS